jgi:malonate transporter and related proteins
MQVIGLLLPIFGVILPLAAALIEIGSQNGERLRLVVLLRGLVRNPILVSIALGFLWHAAALPLPGPLHACLALLAKAAPGLALFYVGTSLPAVPRGFAKEAALAAGLKLAVLPATIGGLAFVAGISGLPLKVALIAAAMPTGPNAFLVAKR